MLVSAFHDDLSVDMPSMQRQVAFALDRGATGIAAFGLAGEGTKLSVEEKTAQTQVIVDEVGGRVPVIVAADGDSSAEIRELAAALAGAGADAIMSMPPKGSDGALAADHYAAVATVGLPVIVQDAPGASGVELTLGQLVEVVERVSAVVGIKVEAPPISMKARQLVDQLPRPVHLIGGRGGLTLLGELAVGVVATMIGPAYLDLVAAVFDAQDEDHRLTAASELLPLVSLSEGNDMYAQYQKHFLVEAGVLETAAMRAPTTPVGDSLMGAAERALAASPAWIARAG